MKNLITVIVLMISTLSCDKKIDIDSHTGVIQKVSDEQSSKLPEELEDCDDKIKKVKEQPVKIDLSNNADEGCTIE